MEEVSYSVKWLSFNETLSDHKPKKKEFTISKLKKSIEDTKRELVRNSFLLHPKAYLKT